MRNERKADEVTRSWINKRFQLLDGQGKALPPMRIPFKCVTVPISQAILKDTGIKCAQVRGMQSTPMYEKAFIKMGEWDTQFPGVVTVAVTEPVIELYKQFFTGKNIDDPKASAQFRQALGAAVMANPDKFAYNCTDGAHRTELGTENFGPEVRAIPQVEVYVNVTNRHQAITTPFPLSFRWNSEQPLPSARMPSLSMNNYYLRDNLNFHY